MRNFRSTLWFKKGAQDADLARDAGPDDVGAVDLLPAEDRYLDDGSVTREDTATFGLHTGGTQYMTSIKAAPGDSGDVGVLVRDIKHGRLRAVMMLAAAAGTCAMMIVLLAR